MGEERTRVVVLGIDDKFVHVYSDAKDMLNANDIGYGPGAHPFPIELFTDFGDPLAGVYDENWRVTQLVACGRPDPDRLLGRLHNVVNNLRPMIRTSAARLALSGMSPADAIEDIDELVVECSSLQDMVALFEYDHQLLAENGGELDDRGRWHNFWNH